MADHIKITPAAGSVTVAAGGTPFGSTDRALGLKEGSYPPVHCDPREDADMSKLERTARSTTCPWKGAASHQSVRTDAGGWKMRSDPIRRRLPATLRLIPARSR
ncbi:MAG: DUF427 domain-containing protein [Tabrizicola sp.]|uniref:DUF427 domain-containing protein n=1 Tax=Tabrizicola sp. TaxID=2005166 RepID=UPI002732790F|nr:DUF427 domain-containing protein [Tabrizicola sp.]MDP3264145.1 DUF427 domain-containing protein [Tabrizicola sp.]MDP3648774.1 DUF427 domain-containing protein [Paracoccaceae bacterium]MDZ4068583.1 DUF427 domain-containing protein [Tabrizicola sp.]